MRPALKNPALLRNQAFVNGAWIDGEGTFAVSNPWDDAAVQEVADLSSSQVVAAIRHAHEAFLDWREWSASERSRILVKWHDLILANQEDLALLMTTEQGKPLAESRGEVLYGASFIEWFAEEGKRVYGDVIPGHQRDKRIIVLKQPVGVVAAITPWNFPIAMITRKVAPALAVGCTVLIKPAESTPLSALALAALAEEAGFPPGVLNVVPTNRPAEVGEVICQSRLVRKLSFTGSTQTGKILMQQASSTVKKLSLELGGNAPFIVFDDADLDAAVAGAILSKYRNSGQTCVCANRIYLQSSIYDKFVDRFVKEVSKLEVGNGIDAHVAIGPLINDAALLKVRSLVEDAVSRGAKLVSGKTTWESRCLEPMVLTGVSKEMKITDQEIFGPVAPIYKFDSDEEAIELANATSAGLAAYFYGQDHRRIWRVAEALEYGMVGINTGLISTAVAPFGGIKESGFGREGSKFGIDEYVNLKYLCFEV